jgi:uncharacterized membrane protein YedE/YeeE
MRDRLLTVLVGVVFGFVLQRTGFSSWDEVHRMFTFADLRLFFGFCFAVVSLFFLWKVIDRWSSPLSGPRKLHRGTVPGAALFGAGWALSGACPSIALVQIGEGKWLGACTLAGILVGNWLYEPIHARFFRWSQGSCIDD